MATPGDLRYSPAHIWVRVDGEVVASNEEVVSRPRLVNDSPYERGWLVQVRLADARQTGRLLDGAAYDALVGSSD